MKKSNKGIIAGAVVVVVFIVGAVAYGVANHTGKQQEIEDVVVSQAEKVKDAFSLSTK